MSILKIQQKEKRRKERNSRYRNTILELLLLFRIFKT